MGIADIIADFAKSGIEWLTISADGGYAFYRAPEGTPITPSEMAQYANTTAKQYNIDAKDYITPVPQAIAIA